MYMDVFVRPVLLLLCFKFIFDILKLLVQFDLVISIIIIKDYDWFEKFATKTTLFLFKLQY